ncbi:probable beta-D-xylosidase 7 isoform X2 [Cryptomeria japonica]|uniref:probable beta-D-xylosidase 7 isoform X2 n=1 Tax=Cryptomeria japonica TaxID=3369 RepID=UPI0027D9F1A3|nr:probable beta-D-xylosidase 7 isoform X2 [Cryptomeria japonica]
MRIAWLLLFNFATNGLLIYGIEPPYSCDLRSPATRTYAFCNSSKAVGERVRDLISRLSLEEKVVQLSNTADGIGRLGVPKYEWWSEALHGVAFGGIRFNGAVPAATSFPQVISTAASFNVRLWYRIAQATGIEARAMYNAGQASGLTFWAPNINIFRDPRWGRGQETPGEDPLVASKYAVAYVRGLQGDMLSDKTRGSPRVQQNLRASACCKHFTAYDLDSWEGTTRYSFNALVTKQDLLDTYQPPFKSCVEQGHASGIMCSYNRVNGVPPCADYDLLTNTARHDWGFQGYITSDCDAVSIIKTDHHYASTAEDAVADVLKAGMDLNCGDYLQRYTISAIQKAKLNESDVDRALYNLFSVRMRLGLFSGDPSQQLYGTLKTDEVCSAEHQEIALGAARQGIVLLKNSRKHLPLSKTQTKSLAVIGPNANNATILLGNYHGIPCRTITPLQGLQKYVKNTLYAPGCENVACLSDTMFNQAIGMAKEADEVVLVVGLDLTQEREEHDRINLNLPGEQQKLVSEVSRAAKRPVVLVILCGGPVDVSFAVNDSSISSIIWAGYPGEAGGQALAEIIFGDYNPGGRLPMTWYPQDFVKVPMTDMNMRPNHQTGYPGRTYRFYRGKTVFKFGHGLSYSRYSHKFSSSTMKEIYVNVTEAKQAQPLDKENIHHIHVEDTHCEGLKFRSHIIVENHGTMSGRHSVLLYSKSPATHKGVPHKQLIGFKNVHIPANHKAKVRFIVKPCEHFGTVEENGRRVLAFGSHFLISDGVQYPVTIIPNYVNIRD